jgi:hypothetical protein
MQAQNSPIACILCATKGEYSTNPLIKREDGAIHCRECLKMLLLETIAHNLGRIAEEVAQREPI